MNENQKPKTADWAPGTLDATRRAIGDIDPEEAKLMAQKLGGEVMYERSETETIRIPSRNRSAGRIIRQDAAMGAENARAAERTQEPARLRRGQADLPIISQKAALKIDKLMMSDEYKIKPNYGLFNFIKRFQRDGHEQIISEFFSYTIKQHVDGIEAFITVIKTLIQSAPAAYKVKIAESTEAKFRFLRMVSAWQVQPLRLLLLDIQNFSQPYYVSDLIPITRAIYRLLVQVYYYGENQIPKLLKEIYTDEAKYPEASSERLASLAKEAITNWLYLQSEVMKKHYPLLMRMCKGNNDAYPEYFKSNVAEILRFVGMHKYDLLLPEKVKAEASKGDAAKPEQPKEPEVGARDKIVDAGIVLLDQLFPEAGFKSLETHPDLYPYFQPLYKFGDGFNVLNPENPLHVTVVLLRILEDFLTGCRNIKFSVTSLDGRKTASDSILTVIDEWTAYRETVFESLYCEPLNNLVNQLYSQTDFESTLFGKKLMTSLLWQTRYHFLPNFTFTQLLLERSPDESKMLPLFWRTDFVRKFLMEAVAQCDKAAKLKGAVEFISNPWEHYKFDLPNEVSKRIDVFLGAQNPSDTTQAHNANLLKYTLCIMAVLDWWINNPESPAYATSPMSIYRVNADDGKPLFSVPVRNDQNKLFADAVRSAFQKKTEG